MNSITVFFEHKDFIIVHKPAGLASAPLDDSGTVNAVSQCAALYPDILQVCGRKEIERGLVHRIDTDTHGLLLFARSNSAYQFFMNVQQEHQFIKEYTAVCSDFSADIPLLEGFPSVYIENKTEQGFTVASTFRSYGPHGSQVRPVRLDEKKSTAASKKAGNIVYVTHIRTLTPYKNGSVTAVCSIDRGYRHQVRCHLSWAGFPVIGDRLYHPEYSNNGSLCRDLRAAADTVGCGGSVSNNGVVDERPLKTDMMFCASGLMFPDPQDKSKNLVFRINRPFSAE